MSIGSIVSAPLRRFAERRDRARLNAKLEETLFTLRTKRIEGLLALLAASETTRRLVN